VGDGEVNGDEDVDRVEESGISNPETTTPRGGLQMCV